MAFKSIHNQNPFVIPGLFFALLLCLRQYFISRPGPYRPYAQKVGTKSVILLSALLGVCLVLVPTFEAYFRIHECRVSDQYMKENLDLAHRAMDVFEQNKIPYWLDYATLLNELREQDLNAWEQDVDFSTLNPNHLQSMRNLPVLQKGETMAKLIDQAKANPQGPYPALNMEDLLEKFHKAGLTTVLLADRGLIQLWGKKMNGPHVDVWLWSAIPDGVTVGTDVPSSSVWSSSTPPQLWSGEEHLGYNPRAFTHIFPLAYSTWLGRPVAVPGDKHAVSKHEFGRYGGSYMTPQVFRGDCFHNFFQLRFMYN